MERGSIERGSIERGDKPGQHDGKEALGEGKVALLFVPQHAVYNTKHQQEAHDGANRVMTETN